MKKSIAITALVLLMHSLNICQTYKRDWEFSKTMNNLPSFIGTGSTERGLSYGKIGGNDRVFLVSRASGNSIRVLDAATGAQVNTLNMTGIAGGTIVINDVEISSDGVIFAANVSTGTSTDQTFKVYRWDNESATPKLVISFTTYTTPALRLGDKITVTGSTADNTITIWASSTTTKLIKFTSTDNGNTFAATTLTYTKNGAPNDAGNTPSVAPIGDGSTGFYIKAAGKQLIRFDANGAKQDSVSASVVASGSSAARYFETNGSKYVVVYNFGASSTTENFSLINVTSGALSLFRTSSMGNNANGNGVGDISVRSNGDGSYTIFTLATNNGISSYTTVSNFTVKFIPQAIFDPATSQLRKSEPITLKLKNTASPYSDVESTTITLDAATYSAKAAFSMAEPGNYYVVVQHRSSVELWSSTAIAYSRGGEFSFDFTSSKSIVYGSNVVEVSSSPSRFAAFSGDVNQDGIIDWGDHSAIDQSVIGYSKTTPECDVNGDGIVDLTDIKIIDNNAQAGVQVSKPN